MIPWQTACTLNPRFPISIILEVSLTSFAVVAGWCSFFPLALPSYSDFFNFSGWKNTVDFIVAIRICRSWRHAVKYSSILCCAFSLADPRKLLWNRHHTRRYCVVICTMQCSMMIDIFRQCTSGEMFLWREVFAYLVFWEFTSKPMFLLAFMKNCGFSLTIFNTLMSSA